MIRPTIAWNMLFLGVITLKKKKGKVCGFSYKKHWNMSGNRSSIVVLLEGKSASLFNRVINCRTGNRKEIISQVNDWERTQNKCISRSLNILFSGVGCGHTFKAYLTSLLSIAVSPRTKLASYQHLPAGLPNTLDFQLLTQETCVHNHFAVLKALQVYIGV